MPTPLHLRPATTIRETPEGIRAEPAVEIVGDHGRVVARVEQTPQERELEVSHAVLVQRAEEAIHAAHESDHLLADAIRRSGLRFHSSTGGYRVALRSAGIATTFATEIHLFREWLLQLPPPLKPVVIAPGQNGEILVELLTLGAVGGLVAFLLAFLGVVAAENVLAYASERLRERPGFGLGLRRAPAREPDPDGARPALPHAPDPVGDTA